MLIDVHCHFSSMPISRRQEILESCPDNYLFIDSSINYQTTLDSLNLSNNYPFIYSAIGFHPFYVRGFNPQIMQRYREIIAKSKKIIAIGEIGLDEKAEAASSEQENVFRIFLKLAKEKNLPVIIHNRRFDKRIISIIDDFYNSYEKIVFHCFSYSTGFLKEIIDKKGYVSFSLNILRKKNNIVGSLQYCPLNNLLLETDSPYMKIREKDSTPLDIKEVYTFAASVKKIDAKRLEEAVSANVNKVFFNKGNLSNE